VRLSVFEPQFREDLTYWVKRDSRTALRALRLIESVMRDPFKGEGKPEPLRHMGPNVWSRRLTREHRLVYFVAKDRISFLQCRFHY